MSEQEQQQRMHLWNAEEIDDELQHVDIQIPVQQYDPRYDDPTQAPIDEAALAAVQQHMALAQVPDVVKRFIVHFHQAVLDNNLSEITAAYESGWTRLTEKFYAKTEWPEAEVIAPLVADDQIFLILYRELYYRHVYSRLQPNIDDRFHSYENSCELFNYLLNSDGPVPLDLPEQWLWDIIDEFIYQFQSFCVWRAKLANRADAEERALLADADAGQVWSAYSVLNVLYSLIQKSKINSYLVATREGKSAEEIAEIAGEYGNRPLYRMLGYFSLVGLLRVHVLLGDFTLALKVIEHVELSQHQRVTACHVATYYYVGFCYIMLRRYPDAIRSFVTILNFILRMRQYHTRSYQYDQISKTADRMYALFALCTALSPSSTATATRLDDNIAATVRERFAEQLPLLTAHDPAAVTELFLHACPKFICATPPSPNEEGGSDPARRHLGAVLADLEARRSGGGGGEGRLRGFLKMYAKVDARRLAGLLDVDKGADGGDGGEEETVQALMAMKMAGRRVSRVGGEKGFLEGTVVGASELSFAINENMIHIAESTVGRRYAGWFIRNTEHAQRVYDGLRAAPLPAAPNASSVGANASNAKKDAQPTPSGAKTGGAKVAWGATTQIKVGA
ncbi:hypothetical protein HWV62_29168 [Athelia sp. TMB]|nr:hypothetical protein HWV62_29168 [Athelia sp. TMB]